MHKKRGYKRELPEELVRDYKLFAIACEGSKREPDYFKLFRHFSKKITVDIIEEVVSDDEALLINSNKSAPKWVLDRAVRYIEKEGLSDEDDLWFVMDIDRWSQQQLREIESHCTQHPNWHIILSNPCFEVWLYFHKKADPSISTSTTCQEFKNEISTFVKGGYHPYKFIPFLPDAIINAQNADSDKNHFIPKQKETKVYELCSAALEIAGHHAFANFVEEKLPNLIELEKSKAQRKKKHRN